MKKPTLQQQIDILRQEIEELKRETNPLGYLGINKSLPPIQMPNGTKNGEWCICGAWKQYGLADQHYCTGGRITC